jgi:hypothetical protein
MWSGFSLIRIGTGGDCREQRDEPSGSGATELVKNALHEVTIGHSVIRLLEFYPQ